EQRGDRLALELAADVPERDVEPAQRMDDRTAAAEIVQQALAAGAEAGIGRILPDREMLEPGVEHRRNERRAAAEGLAPADHPAPGGDAHQQHVDMRARPACEQRRRRPDVERNAQLDGVDGGDGGGGHAFLPINVLTDLSLLSGAWQTCLLCPGGVSLTAAKR